ncbi:unnamed protein product [Enterobius vermicularis]|uniref:Pre-mRNA-splicing factor SYF1 n=1 Tax=Enterobius vermicularis TaxID=51028 RepID=A0A0N4UVE1_ENTVE|nr:unnamed protein product [Enterobius vermicularis]
MLVDNTGKENVVRDSEVEPKKGKNDEDLGFEEDILRNPFSLRSWLRYIEHKKKHDKSLKQINLVYERALKELPGSYKLWYSYLRFRRKLVADKCPTDPAYQRLNNVYERALVFMHKMPRIWMDYCELMTQQRYITSTRRVFDRALRALPVTQHDRIWPLYIKFVTSHKIPETTIRVYRRCLMLFPEYRENFVDYLIGIDRVDEAGQQLAILVNDDKLVSPNGKTTYQLWTELCELISKNPNKVHSLNVDAIIRQGIQRYTDQVGSLWCALAEYYIRAGRFEKARDVYEEAIVTVKTVRDFTQVFDAYSRFSERATCAKMDMIEKEGSDEESRLELELLFEYLLERRPLLLSSVLLRQNPHNAHEWLNRVELFKGNKAKQIETFNEAVATVDPKYQTGKLSNIWIKFAKFYAEEGDIEKARETFEKGLQSNYVKVDDLATVWCEYVEMELKLKKLMQRATAIPPRRSHYFDESEPVQFRVYKSLKVWSLCADIEEAFGTLEDCQAVYERIIDLRIATPQIIINYAKYLEENNYFENAFAAYEKGIALFKWPIVNEIWHAYLVSFLKRYGGKKLERARDLFEQCLENCPPKFAMCFYLLYAKLEEEHGLPRHAMNIYSRATTAVERSQMYKVFNIYIKKAMSMYGMTQTRPIFQTAIEMLPEDESRKMSIRFAQMERTLGEIDRARAIYAHCSEICDPRVHGQFWETWKEFEIKHGNEDTVREMLRIKRSVQAAYNANVNIMSAQMLVYHWYKTVHFIAEAAGDSMVLLEARAQKIAEEEGGFKPVVGNSQIRFVRGEGQTTKDDTAENPDEINIEDDEDDGKQILNSRKMVNAQINEFCFRL